MILQVAIHRRTQYRYLKFIYSLEADGDIAGSTFTSMNRDGRFHDDFISFLFNYEKYL